MKFLIEVVWVYVPICHLKSTKMNYPFQPSTSTIIDHVVLLTGYSNENCVLYRRCLTVYPSASLES